MSQKLGFAAEKQACDYLTRQGLQKVTNNYRCRLGEIDLIMRDKEYLVFVEVRARRSSSHGCAVESITYHKRQKLIRAASLYLTTHNLYDKCPCRFDVLSLDGDAAQIHWFKNAFGLDG